MDEVNLFTQLLWGTGAIFGHLIILFMIWFFKRKAGSWGAVVGLILSSVMMILVFNNMPVDNDAFIFVILYFLMAIISVINPR